MQTATKKAFRSALGYNPRRETKTEEIFLFFRL